MANEELNVNETPAEDNRKVVTAYTILHYSDDSVDVQNAQIEGVETTELTNEGIYRDIEDVARKIYFKRIVNACRTAQYEFYSEISKQQAAAAHVEPEAPAEE